MKPTESFIGQPVRSLQTMLRVISEYDGSIPTVVPDGIYGAETIRAITKFQQLHDLPPTGITDQQTWEAVVEVYDEAAISIMEAEPIRVIWDPNKIFILGESSPYLYLAQSMLIYLADTNDAISRPEHNGILDRKTAASLTDFQNLSALPPTGQLDKKTWKHLSGQFTLHANLKDPAERY